MVSYSLAVFVWFIHIFTIPNNPENSQSNSIHPFVNNDSEVITMKRLNIAAFVIIIRTIFSIKLQSKTILCNRKNQK